MVDVGSLSLENQGPGFESVSQDRRSWLVCAHCRFVNCLSLKRERFTCWRKNESWVLMPVGISFSQVFSEAADDEDPMELINQGGNSNGGNVLTVNLRCQQHSLTEDRVPVTPLANAVNSLCVPGEQRGPS